MAELPRRDTRLPSAALPVLADRFVQIYLAVAAIIAAVYTLPVARPDELQRFGQGAYLLPFVGLVAVAAFDSLHSVNDANERRFWAFQGTAFSIWMVALAAAAATPDARWTLVHEVLSDGAYTLVYALLLLGFEHRPHVPPALMSRQAEASRQFRSIGLMCLCAGWFVYFVVIPVRFDTPFYESGLPSALLFMAADVVLATRIALFLGESRGTRWRRIYGALLAGALTLLAVDALEAAAQAGWVDVPGGTWRDFAWALPPLVFLVGIRWHRLPDDAPVLDRPRTRQEARDLEPEQAGSLLISAAAAFPIANVAQQTTAELGRSLERVQDTAALLGMLTMAGLAAAAYSVLARARAAVEQAHDERDARLREVATLAAVSRLAAVAHREMAPHVHAARVDVDRATNAANPVGDQRDRLASARGHLEAVDGFVQRLRTISRQLPMRPVNRDLNATILDLAPTLRGLSPGPVTLDLRLGTDAPRVMVDPDALRDVLLALAENAHEAMPNGGTLSVTTGQRELHGAEAVARAVRPGRYGRIIVRDTGLGMSRDTVSHAFEPFYGARDNGRDRGMGLARVYAVIAQHGGTVGVDSTVDAGTTIDILIPEAAPRGA